jgi:hypothetical protein
VAEGDGLLNRFTGNTVTGVRIPPSPPVFAETPVIQRFFALTKDRPARQLSASSGKNLPKSACFWANIWANKKSDFPLGAHRRAKLLVRPGPPRRLENYTGRRKFWISVPPNEMIIPRATQEGFLWQSKTNNVVKL